MAKRDFHKLDARSASPLVIQRRVLAQPDGSSAVSLTIDLSRVEAPERKYFADVVGVVPNPQGVAIQFAQRKVSNSLRSLVIVTMYAEAVRQFITQNAPVTETVRALLEKNRVPPFMLTMIDEEPTQTVSLTANAVGCAAAGREAVLDFFHAGPQAMQTQVTGPIAQVEAVVRVDLAANAFLALLDELSRLVPNLPPDIR